MTWRALPISPCDPEMTTDNWIGAMDADDRIDGSSPSEQYVVAFYWAIMTMTTIGYGRV